MHVSGKTKANSNFAEIFSKNKDTMKEVHNVKVTVVGAVSLLFVRSLACFLSISGRGASSISPHWHESLAWEEYTRSWASNPRPSRARGKSLVIVVLYGPGVWTRLHN